MRLRLFSPSCRFVASRLSGDVGSRLPVFASPSGSYEPPLTNVFTMQWFLTMFATCLPAHTVLRIWDSVFFEGSEVLFRVALAIWERLGEWVDPCFNRDAPCMGIVKSTKYKLGARPGFISIRPLMYKKNQMLQGQKLVWQKNSAICRS